MHASTGCAEGIELTGTNGDRYVTYKWLWSISGVAAGISVSAALLFVDRHASIDLHRGAIPRAEFQAHLSHQKERHEELKYQIEQAFAQDREHHKEALKLLRAIQSKVSQGSRTPDSDSPAVAGDPTNPSSEAIRPTGSWWRARSRESS